ncbi:Na-translocating system protein MpsC family protein [Virgibacillus sp. SK37]|uniref:Na-translocating system protein MpsC family protein n=1 Tax=Virgibacillus sp. SK37 TaxID=403957 RepID=UPI0004D12F08|nr:Na-translocating system protein MpsC family protein [Virgibacillus sp. SK37]AIF44721.1 hypothetical protein X953_17630 [Virgibacillus sp. SK37]
MSTKSQASIIASSVGKLLRDNFGKGPGSIYVSISRGFVTMYLQNFLAPMERILLNQKNDLKIQETRDLMMSELIPEIKWILTSELNSGVKTILYDWELEKKSGIIFAEMEPIFNESEEEDLDYPAKEKLHGEINRFTEKAQKTPMHLVSYKLNERTIISRREEILVLIEKELIQSGFSEQLRLSKRKLEKSLINIDYIESVLNQEIQDIFVDWDFSDDVGYVVFILKPTK